MPTFDDDWLQRYLDRHPVEAHRMAVVAPKAAPRIPSPVTPAPALEAPRGQDTSLVRSVCHVTLHELQTRTETNNNEFWRKRHSRAKRQLLMTQEALCAVWLPCTVTLTRIAPRELDTGDNLPSALKHCRDGIADWLGIDDRDPRVTWVYGQRRGAAKYYGVEILIEAQEGGPDA
jgi:hypothetical protein